MKKIVFFVLLMIIFVHGYGQSVSGIWLSLDNKTVKRSVDGLRSNGLLLDFDNNTLSDIESKTAFETAINQKKGRIKARGIKGKWKYQKINEHSMLVKSSKTATYVFKKLDLSNKIDWAENDITDFLVDQQCTPVAGLNLLFYKNKYETDDNYTNIQIRKQLLNKEKKEYGYWFVSVINKNPFIIFTTRDNGIENIYQISQISLNGFQLKPIQTEKAIKNLKEIKTCL